MASGGQRDEFGRFAKEAGDALRDFSRGVEESTRATQEHTRSTREEREAQKALTGNVNAGLGVAGNALSAATTTGDFDAGLASVTRAGISAIRGAEISGIKVGEFAAETSGLNRADRVLGTAAERTLDVTADLARYGIEVDPDFRERTLNTAIEQEKRVEDERAKVSAAAFSPGNVGAIASEQGTRLLALVEKIANALGGGGAN